MLRIGRLAKRIMMAAYPSRKQLAHELFDWHGGPLSGLRTVATAWLNGNEAKSGDIDRAISELQDLLSDEVPHGSEVAYVRELKQKLKAEIARFP